MTAFGSTVELRLNASGNCAAREGVSIVSERNRGLRASETRLVARTIAPNARHKRASGIPSRYAKARHLPCTLSWRGAYLPTHVREGCTAGRGLASLANNTHLSPKVRRFTPHSWSNGRQPPTATCGNARDQPPSQRHAAWKLHYIVRNREGDDELSRPEGPVASLPARIAFGSLIRKKTEDEKSRCFASLPGTRRVEKKPCFEQIV